MSEPPRWIVNHEIKKKKFQKASLFYDSVREKILSIKQIKIINSKMHFNFRVKYKILRWRIDAMENHVRYSLHD